MYIRTYVSVMYIVNWPMLKMSVFLDTHRSPWHIQASFVKTFRSLLTYIRLFWLTQIWSDITTSYSTGFFGNTEVVENSFRQSCQTISCEVIKATSSTSFDICWSLLTCVGLFWLSRVTFDLTRQHLRPFSLSLFTMLQCVAVCCSVLQWYECIWDLSVSPSFSLPLFLCRSLSHTLIFSCSLAPSNTLLFMRVTRRRVSYTSLQHTATHCNTL